MSISIATISWARDASEESLLRKSLSVLAGLHIPVFVCDGGSGDDFLNFLKSFPHFTVLKPAVKGLWPQAKTSLLAAHDYGSEFIFYTEPDKLEFFTTRLGSFLAQASSSEQTGIVLASRSEKAFKTFPQFQQSTETAINRCCFEVAGSTVDYTYGPFLLNRRLVPYASHVPENIGWGWRPFMFGIAKRSGYTVEAIEDDFFCPADQRTDDPEERIYRMKQLSQNIDGIVLSAKAELGLPQ